MVSSCKCPHHPASTRPPFGIGKLVSTGGAAVGFATVAVLVGALAIVPVPRAYAERSRQVPTTASHDAASGGAAVQKLPTECKLRVVSATPLKALPYLDKQGRLVFFVQIKTNPVLPSTPPTPALTSPPTQAPVPSASGSPGFSVPPRYAEFTLPPASTEKIRVFSKSVPPGRMVAILSDLFSSVAAPFLQDPRIVNAVPTGSVELSWIGTGCAAIADDVLASYAAKLPAADAPVGTGCSPDAAGADATQPSSKRAGKRLVRTKLVVAQDPLVPVLELFRAALPSAPQAP